MHNNVFITKIFLNDMYMLIEFFQYSNRATYYTSFNKKLIIGKISKCILLHHTKSSLFLQFILCYSVKAYFIFMSHYHCLQLLVLLMRPAL